MSDAFESGISAIGEDRERQDRSSNIMGDDPSHWVQLVERDGGNVGLECVVNPRLYPLLIDVVNACDHRQVQMADFGAGTMKLGRDILFGVDRSLGLQLARDVAAARRKIEYVFALEVYREFLSAGEAEVMRMGLPFFDAKKLIPLRADLESPHSMPLEDSSLDVAVSRHFLMHLSSVGLSHHLYEIARVLKKNGAYIFTVLNPAYESAKYTQTYPDAPMLTRGQSYDYPHGDPRHPLGHLQQYHHSVDDYAEAVRAAGLSIKNVQPLVGDVGQVGEAYSRYCDENTPMGLMFHVVR